MSLRWPLIISCTSVRLIHWRWPLSELNFEVKRKKGTPNDHSYAWSWLPTTGGTTVDAEEDDHPSLLMESIGCEDGAEYCTDECLAVSEHSRPVLQSFSTGAFVREQSHDTLCRQLRARLDSGHRIPFVLDYDGVLQRTTDSSNRIVVLYNLRSKILHMINYKKTGGHPGGRKLYHTLHHWNYCPSISVDCYAVARSCISCAKERMKRRRQTTPIKLFQAIH